jgi:hypothetical protein
MITSLSGIILAVIVFCCILPAGYYLFIQPKVGKSPEAKNETKENNNNIVGLSKTRLGLNANVVIRNDANKRLVIPSEEMEQVFYTREEARLNIDVDIEPGRLSNEQEEEEDPLLFKDADLVPVLASGASFDELAEMSEAIQSHLCDLSHAHLVKTAKTIRTVENTDLLEKLIRQVEGGTQKIADILDRCDAELKASVTKGPKNIDMGEFDLERYL